MKKIILACVMFLSAIAVAGPRVDDHRAPNDNAMIDDDRPDGLDFSCNTGGPTSLLAGAVVLGLFARRRRRVA